MAPKKRASADTSPKASKRTKVAKVVPAVILSDDEVEPPKSKSKVKAKGKDAKSVTPSITATKPATKPATNLYIPVDEHCTLNGSHKVHIDEDSIIFDALLNQTNTASTKGSNKFYRMQLLHDGAQDFRVWTRWGRVGYEGSHSLLGDGTLAGAMREFDKKFRDKSGLPWTQRFEAAKTKKYVFLERDYEPDASQDAAKDTSPKEDSEEFEMEESTLLDPIQRLMEMIFNKGFMYDTMQALDYDAEKLPLGKLSKRTITQAYQTLKDLSAHLIATPTSSSGSEVENLSNMYFSLIPHDFGYKKPPTIATPKTLKKELDLLDSLSDMKIADDIMKSVKDAGIANVNHLDRQFQNLNLTELTPLDSMSDEYNELKGYLTGTQGFIHAINYGKVEIFRLERNGEFERFEKSDYAKLKKSDRRLLWHGSRATNFGGILSAGLRIAPPEAPVNGYMFSKGIYMADMSTKSANYCMAHNSGGEGLLLLCEAELGSPMLELTHFDYEADIHAKAKGAISTFGKGSTGPRKWKDAKCVHKALKGVKMPDMKVALSPEIFFNGGLVYNEFIAYDVAQIRLRYLFRVEMKH